jgi:hypothetical protein
MGKQHGFLEAALAEMRVGSTAIPESGASFSRMRGSKVSGTRAGRVSVTVKPNWVAS